MSWRNALMLLPIAALAAAAASGPARAGDYGYGYGYRAYGDCADDWRYCDRYLRDDAPYYYRSGYYGGRDYGYGYRYYDRPYGYSYGYGYGVVCDSDGDRCYSSLEPYWNYREYYRRHGYHWLD
jgi:hypothetical protein